MYTVEYERCTCGASQAPRLKVKYWSYRACCGDDNEPDAAKRRRTGWITVDPIQAGDSANFGFADEAKNPTIQTEASETVQTPSSDQT